MRYGPAVQDFLTYARERGEDLYDKDDAVYCLAHYIHLEYAKGPTARGTRKGRCHNERTAISQKKSKTTEAVANRGVDADAPRGENEDQKKEERKRRDA